PSEVRERGTQLRMEHDEQRDRTILEDEPEDGRDHPELQQIRRTVGSDQDGKPQQDADGARALKEQEDAIQHEAHERDLQHVAPAWMQEPEVLNTHGSSGKKTVEKR